MGLTGNVIDDISDMLLAVSPDKIFLGGSMLVGDTHTHTKNGYGILLQTSL